MKGFTLIETLVAITVLLLAIMGPFQLVHQALVSSYIARDQLIASALAEEGVEFVRIARDSNYIYNLRNPSTPRFWLYGLDGAAGCISANGCTIDAFTRVATACSSTCPVLYRNTTDNRYTQTVTTAPTQFTRKVAITQVTATEVIVTVTVSWTRTGTPYTVTVSNHLHNWL